MKEYDGSCRSPVGRSQCMLGQRGQLEDVGFGWRRCPCE